MYTFLISEQNYKTTVSIDGGLERQVSKRNSYGSINC